MYCAPACKFSRSSRSLSRMYTSSAKELMDDLMLSTEVAPAYLDDD